MLFKFLKLRRWECYSSKLCPDKVRSYLYSPSLSSSKQLSSFSFCGLDRSHGLHPRLTDHQNHNRKGFSWGPYANLALAGCGFKRSTGLAVSRWTECNRQTQNRPQFTACLFSPEHLPFKGTNSSDCVRNEPLHTVRWDLSFNFQFSERFSWQNKCHYRWDLGFVEISLSLYFIHFLRSHFTSIILDASCWLLYGWKIFQLMVIAFLR